MKKTLSIAISTILLAFAASADDTKTTTDTTHNPVTGNDTVTQETVTKNEQGETVATKKMKTKRDHKTGRMKKKTMDSEKMNSDGDTIEKSKTEQTNPSQ
jgi:hypothetical protein